MSKQLSVILKAVDQATAPSKAVASSLLGIGQAGAKADKMVRDAFGGVSKTLGQLKAVAVGAFAVFATGRVVGSIQQTAKGLDDLGKAARRYGMSVEELSALKYGADLANVSFETVAAAVGKAQKNLGQFAQTGGGKAAQAIRELGLNVRDSSGHVRKMSELLPEFAERFRTMTVDQREYFSSKIFGDGGGELAFFLSEGAERLKDYRAEAEKLGVVFSKDLTDAAEEYMDSLTRISYAWDGLKARLVGAVAPALTEVFNRMSEFAAAAPEMARNFGAVFSGAMGGDAESRERLTRLAASYFDVIKSAVVGGIRLIMPLVRDGWREISATLDADIRAWIEGLFEKLGFWVSIGVNKAQLSLSEAVLPKFLVERDRGIFGGRIDAALTEIDAINRKVRDTAQTTLARDEALRRSIASDDYPEFKRVVGEITADLNKQTEAFGEAADAVFQWKEALGRGARVGDLPNRPGFDPDVPNENDPAAPGKFTGGMREGLEELLRASKEMAAQGRALVLGIAGAFSQNLSSAIYNVLAGVENLKDAFRNFFQQTLSQVSQLIIQMLVLRAVGGIAGGILGGGASAAVSVYPAHANGAVFSRGGVVPFASGGIVDGPTLFPMRGGRTGLMGEAGPEAVMPLKRGSDGRLGVTVSGGGGGVVVNQTFNITGGSSESAERVKRAARDGVLEGLVEALRRSPGGREELRRALG